MKNYPFIFGTQYYRAPTPEIQCWEKDLKKMHDMGFNSVKFWAQWRWSHRSENEFYFDDLDMLMDLAYKFNLKVTINVIFDVSPIWLYEKYPDAVMVTSSGEKLTPRTANCRQIGGVPGPCYTHKGAIMEREKFLAAVVDHFKGHPAMDMWDVWNEPEQCMFYRSPDMNNIVCYCPSCTAKFKKWLKAKYETIENLNEVWGRCYGNFNEVELPKCEGTVMDFIDFREFHLDNMTEEANRRIDIVKSLDREHITYLHVVPNNLHAFNTMTGVDDFALSEKCDVFAETGGKYGMSSLAVSAGKSKICYNVESHMEYGSLGSHEPILGLEDVKKDFIAQIGTGIRGFLFWQFRSEVLGNESPAWGIVRLDGSDRPVTKGVRDFWSGISPYKERIMKSFNEEPQVGIWKSRKNELLCYCAYGSFKSNAESLGAYMNTLYWNNYHYRIFDNSMLEDGRLENLKLIIMPDCYGLTQKEADSLDKWVRSGGTLLCEAHLGGYNLTTGRHSRTVPGCGLAESWGINEFESTSPYHLQEHDGKYFTIGTVDGNKITGAQRCAFIVSDECDVLAAYNDIPCIIAKKVEKGTVIYCGTNLGEGSSKDQQGFRNMIKMACEKAGVKPVMNCVQHTSEAVHVDLIKNPEGDFIVLYNQSEETQEISLEHNKKFKGVFSGLELDFTKGSRFTLPPDYIDLFVEG